MHAVVSVCAWVLAVNKSAFSPQRLSLAVLTWGQTCTSTATNRGWDEKAWERGYSAVAVRNNACVHCRAWFPVSFRFVSFRFVSRSGFYNLPVYFWLKHFAVLITP